MVGSVLGGALRILLVVTATLSAWRLIDLAASLLMQRAARTASRVDDILIPLVTRAVKLFVLTMGFIYAAGALDVPIAPLLASLSSDRPAVVDALARTCRSLGVPATARHVLPALERAVDVILRSQCRAGGWGYQPQSDGREDTSCTQTVFHALASARQAGIFVPNETISKVVKFLERAKDPTSGGFWYTLGGNRNVTPACTAGGTYIAQLAGQRDTELVSGALRHLESLSPGIITGGGSYYYYTHYYAIQAMVQTGDEQYARWYPQVREALIKRQTAAGAWNKGRGQGGSSYATPMAIIILATPHRYIPIYQR